MKHENLLFGEIPQLLDDSQMEGAESLPVSQPIKSDGDPINSEKGKITNDH
jgi:hypothetical protein